MEALGSPSISRGVYADDRYNDTIVRLPESILLLQDFPKDFWPFMRYFRRFVSFFFFFSESAQYEKQKNKKTKKKHMKITTIYKPVEQTHACIVLILRLSREKSVKYLCYVS